MSDFGCLLVFKKQSGSLSQTDKELIINELSQEISEGSYSFMIEEGDYKTIYEWEDNSFCIRLTEYYSDEDEEEIWEFAQEEDLSDAKEIAEKLQLKFENSIDFTAIFTDW